MSGKAHPEDEKPNAIFHHDKISETAASAHNPLFPSSGVMLYRVTVANGAALTTVDVEAATGDEAAAKAIAGQPGLKVAHVEPAPQKRAA